MDDNITNINDTQNKEEQNSDIDIKPIIEVLIFAADEPINFKSIRQVLPHIEKDDVDNAIIEINQEYEETKRPFKIQEAAGGWQMITLVEYAFWLKKIYSLRKKGKLSKPALETLSIIAYKQPVTKIEVENIRGVSADGVMRMLLEKDFVKILGRKDVPGRPIIYGTTDKFLRYFGLTSIKDLPDFKPNINNESEIKQESLEIIENGKETE